MAGDNFIHSHRNPGWISNRPFVYIIILTLTIITFLIGLGSFTDLAPYSLFKNLPILGSMRVSSRWFIFTLLGFIVLIGLSYKVMPKKSFSKLLVLFFVIVSVIELFVQNYNYQSVIFTHKVIPAEKETSQYSFEQSKQFGSTNTFPDGKRIFQSDNNLPHFYREYEATTYNIGTIQANDAFIDLSTLPTPRCGIEDGCGLVLTSNAEVTKWTPNEVVLTRTARGPIKLNMNNSSYFLINGVRNANIKTVEAYSDFVIEDESTVITIVSSPPLIPKIVK